MQDKDADLCNKAEYLTPVALRLCHKKNIIFLSPAGYFTYK